MCKLSEDNVQNEDYFRIKNLLKNEETLQNK